MLGRYDRAMRARQPVGRLTLLQQAIPAIRRNNGALLYVPTNFAGAWTDSAGTDPVNEIADVIGRMTDRTGGSAVATQSTTASKPLVHRVPKRFGPNLVSNGNITGLPAGGGTRYYNMTGAMTPLAAGKTYLMTHTVSGYSGTGNVGIAGAAPAGIVQTKNTANGSYRVVQTPTAGGVIVFYTTNTNTANFSAIDVREVLEWSYAMSFDGSNDSLSTNITTGNEGWVCAGVTFGGPVGNFETVFANGAGSPTQKGVWLVRTAATKLLRMGIGNGTALTMPTITVLMGIPQVVEGGWTSTTVTVGLNGATSSLARTGNATPAPYESLIGAYIPIVHFLNGPMTALVYCPSLPSSSDRAIIRKCIGSLQGQTL